MYGEPAELESVQRAFPEFMDAIEEEYDIDGGYVRVYEDEDEFWPQIGIEYDGFISRSFQEEMQDILCEILGPVMIQGHREDSFGNDLYTVIDQSGSI